MLMKELIDEYLAKRPKNDEYFELDCCEQEKYITFSQTLIDLFYKTAGVEVADTDLAKIYGEESIYLIQNSMVFEELVQKYEGLSSVSVGNGAVTCTVNYDDRISLISPIVRAMLNRLGIEELQSDPNSGFQFVYAENIR